MSAGVVGGAEFVATSPCRCGQRDTSLLGPLEVVAAGDVVERLGGIGRTEDIAVSPDGRRLVIAGFVRNELSILVHEADFRAGRVHIRSLTTSTAEGLSQPHGVTFLDDCTLIVANRESELLLVELDAATGTRIVATRVLIDGSFAVPVRTPGSVAARLIADDLFEIVVCNNFAHDVTRYLLDAAADWAIVDAEVLIATGLAIPDGVAISESGDWLAVSNHDRNAVYVYPYTADLRANDPPAGVLTGMNYPHGLRFVDNDHCLVVADAGLPYVHVFDSSTGRWDGERTPATTRVMTDEVFNSGRHNPQEGGPKGLAVVGHDLIAITSEFQPLAFHRLRRDRAVVSLADGHRASNPTSSAARQSMLRLARRLDDREASNLHATAEAQRWRDDLAVGVAEIGRLAERVEALEGHIDLVHASTSWRVSAPVRWCSSVVSAVRRVGAGVRRN